MYIIWIDIHFQIIIIISDNDIRQILINSTPSWPIYILRITMERQFSPFVFVVFECLLWTLRRLKFASGKKAEETLFDTPIGCLSWKAALPTMASAFDVCQYELSMWMSSLHKSTFDVSILICVFDADDNNRLWKTWGWQWVKIGTCFQEYNWMWEMWMAVTVNTMYFAVRFLH